MANPIIYVEDIDGGWSSVSGSITVGKMLPTGDERRLVPAVYVDPRTCPVFVGTEDDCRHVARLLTLEVVTAKENKMLRVWRPRDGELAAVAVGSTPASRISPFDATLGGRGG